MRFIIGCVTALTLCALTACETSSDASEARAAERRQAYQQSVANDVLGKLVYLQDSRTGICFAYLWSGAANGGPALATVPCERVPSDLLVTTMGEYE